MKYYRAPPQGGSLSAPPARAPAAAALVLSFCMKRFLFRLFLFACLLAALAAGGAWWYAHRALPLPTEPLDFTVERGYNMRQAANAIARAGVPIEPAALYWMARLSGKAQSIKAGSYEVHTGVTPWELILKLSAGDVSQGELLVVEGWTFRQMRDAVESNPNLKPDSVGLTDAELLQRIGVADAHPEGLFFPDTYLFDKQSSAIALFKRAYGAMQEHLQKVWAERDPTLPLASPYQALILASIIEKETGRPEDRGLVASVFVNRLKVGMRLQTDPTVIYGLGSDFDGRLRKRQLETDHPWNTYTRIGLPPTPIAMPGRESLLAAVRPPQTDLYYFVSRGDGSSEFSRNLDDHNRAVNRYQRGSRGN